MHTDIKVKDTINNIAWIQLKFNQVNKFLREKIKNWNSKLKLNRK